ncbi:MAG: hypothetical protein ACP5XB_26650 [Isosphaeraceae bacterium]
MRAQVTQDPEATEREEFERLKKLYERVCHPHRMAGLYNTEHGLDMEFTGERGDRYYSSWPPRRSRPGQAHQVI